jgi:hypothetical protein
MKSIRTIQAGLCVLGLTGSLVLQAGAAVARTAHADGPCSYKATFVEDVTIPDDMVIAAGASFAKTWRVRNDGTCTWGSNGYALNALAFVGGDRLNAPDRVPLPGEVQPGDTVDLSVSLTAPAQPGTYTSQWKLWIDNPDYRYVGVGRNGDRPLYTRIMVDEGDTSPASGGPIRVSFMSGATSVAVSGNLGARSSEIYVVRAMQGQFMLLTLASSSGAATLQVFRFRDGLPLAGRNPQNTMGWLGQLPSTGDYGIRIRAGAQATNYSLNITIPQRISFARGAYDASVSGVTSKRQTVTYLLRSRAGQTMTARFTSPGNAIGLTIYGLQDGSPLVRAVSGATQWTGRLPGTQDYVIEAVPATESVVNFTLDVQVR